ncbi:hypothetical protein E5D57_000862 [Metarhizium anisopliae]|nr:hypothetical protein E5D57_000862 [Metarhizium anisopliae]
MAIKWDLETGVNKPQSGVGTWRRRLGHRNQHPCTEEVYTSFRLITLLHDCILAYDAVQEVYMVEMWHVNPEHQSTE